MPLLLLSARQIFLSAARVRRLYCKRYKCPCMHENRVWPHETSYHIIACCYIATFILSETLHSVFTEVMSLFPPHCHCEILQKWSEGYNNHCRTKNFTWSTWTNSPIWRQTSAYITDIHNNIMNLTINKNFCNDHVITKISFYKNLEPYSSMYYED